MLLIVVCVAYVISDVSTHRLPIVYYEGYFTYLYGASILFLLYVFCFLLQGKFFIQQKSVMSLIKVFLQLPIRLWFRFFFYVSQPKECQFQNEFKSLIIEEIQLPRF